MLFEPLTIKEVTLRNRIVVSPMCQYSSVDGFASDWHLVHYGSRAVGGAGAVIVEATAVEPRGRITPHDLGIWKDEHLEKLGQIARFIDEHGAVPGIQIAHAGRKASMTRPWDGEKLVESAQGGWTPLAPSAISFYEGAPAPEALTVAGIKAVVQQFKDAASRALTAGFKIVELHAAHGYLLHEFLSPLSNHRQDEYGGSLENRLRLPLEVATAVRSVWPQELPLFTRISATDWAEQGWDLEQSVVLARRLKSVGVDLIDCSAGALIPHVKMPVGPGFQVPFSQRIRHETGILTGAVAVITSGPQADTILRSGQADIVLIGRQFLRDPYFPFHAAQELNKKIAWPLQYLRAAP